MRTPRRERGVRILHPIWIAHSARQVTRFSQLLRKRKREERLLHQMQASKLGADISAAVTSTAFFWQHKLAAGLIVRYAPPIASSALVLRLADLEKLRQTRCGRYVRALGRKTTSSRSRGEALRAATAIQCSPTDFVHPTR
jgi:hypothetical protein